MEERKEPKRIIIQETDKMANWLHPQNDKRKKRFKDRIDGVKERFKKLKERLNGETGL